MVFFKVVCNVCSNAANFDAWISVCVGELEVLRRLFPLIALVSLFWFEHAASCYYLFVFGSDSFRYFGSEVALCHFVAGVWILPWLTDVLLLCVIEEILRRSFYFKALVFQISLCNLQHFCRSSSLPFALATLDQVL